jgi:hypothetical protein
MMKAPFATIAILLIGGSVRALSASTPTYDGKWWLSVDKWQREGFVDGYLACYIIRRKRRDKVRIQRADVRAPRN